MRATTPFSLDTVPIFTETRSLELPQLKIDRRSIAVEVAGLTIQLSLADSYEDLGSTPGVWQSRLESLAAVPAHDDAGAGLRRFRFIDAPYHSALHVIDDAARTTPGYCTIHDHNDAAELNVIVPSVSGLSYDVYSGEEWEKVDTPTVLWFPPARPHCAIAKQGSGLFFVARLPAPRRARDLLLVEGC